MNTRSLKLILIVIVLFLSSLACITEREVNRAVDTAADTTMEIMEEAGQAGCELASDVNQATGLGGPCTGAYDKALQPLNTALGDE